MGRSRTARPCVKKRRNRLGIRGFVEFDVVRRPPSRFVAQVAPEVAMSSLDEPMTPEDAFGQISRAASAQRPLADLFRTLADVAYQALPHSPAVSVTVVRRTVSGTAAYRGRNALALDEVQYRWGDGPCMHAATTGQMVVIEDVAADDRWPEFTSSAASADVHSVMSVPLTNDVVRGSLNIYAGDTAILDSDAISLAQALATHFASAINESPTE